MLRFKHAVAVAGGAVVMVLLTNCGQATAALNAASVRAPSATSVLPVAANATTAPAQATAQPAALAPTVQPTPAPVLRGSVQQETIHSAFLHGDEPMLIYLPPGYQEATKQRYPVAYLLHGAPGRFSDWNGPGGASVTAERLITSGNIPPMILVMPEGQCNYQQDSEWVNGSNPNLQAESYLLQEVVPYIDSHYRTVADAQHRTIGGLSTGAYGGVNAALRHPDVFANGFGISGNYLPTKTILSKPLFTDQATADANSPLLLAATVAHPDQLHIYLAVGNRDTADDTLHQTQEMDEAMAAARIPHWVDYDPGTHSWQFWNAHLGNALRSFAATLGGG